jgi:hypothetical protein
MDYNLLIGYSALINSVKKGSGSGAIAFINDPGVFPN